MRTSGYDETRTFEDGETIEREGDDTRDMYIVRGGCVEVFKTVDGEQVLLAVLDRGSFFGEMSRPGRVRLASGATYYNTGAWLHRPWCVVVDHGRIWFGLVSDLLLDKATFEPVTAGVHGLDATVHAVSPRLWSHA